MEQRSKKDLVKFIDQQQDKLTKYEAKIRNVVAAYKGLLNEKTALEATVKSLSHASFMPSSESTKAAAQAEGGEEFVDPLNAKAALSSGNQSSDQLKERIMTLTKALSTVTEEKSRMEANFQADTKKLRQEKQELENKYHDEQAKNKLNEETFQANIQQLKTRLRNQQYEHEKEQNNQRIMLRELQQRINEDRLVQEQLENQLEEAQLAMAIRESQPNHNEKDAKKIASLSSDVKNLSAKLQLAEEKANAPMPLFLQLQQEMEEIKAQHRLNIQQEKRRVTDAEDRLALMGKVSESRAAELEAKVSELSETLGTYDRQRQQDQMAIQRLKERVSQLDVENSALARAASCLNNSQSFEKELDESNLDVEALVEKITKLNSLLQRAKENPNHSFMVEYPDLHGQQLMPDNPHYYCQCELQQLKDEFDEYKCRTQSTLKTRRKDNDTNKEIDGLKKQNKDLRETIKDLKSEMTEAEQNYISTVTVLRSSLGEAKSVHKKEIASIEGEWRAKLSSLEQQLQKQRERSFTVLEEKDGEIFSLRNQFRKNESFSGSKKLNKASSFPEKMGFLKNEVQDTEEVISELSNAIITDKEAQFLHYMQELARKDVEISNLRRSKHQSEAGLREMQLTYLSKEESYENQIEDLSAQVLRLEHNTSREGANLEYLKNVVLSYMLSSSSQSKYHMLNAIAAVLKFTSKEFETVKQFNCSWW